MIRYIGMRVETEGGLNELQIYLEYADGGELFDQIDVLKISDFGMATVFRHSDRERMLNATCGTLPYASPQVIKGLYKECPAYREWVNGTIVVTENNPWKKIDTTALSLIRAILTEDENTRATLQRIMEHPLDKHRLRPAASQPSAVKWTSSVVNGYNSFSQPAEAPLLLSNSQLSQNVDIDPMTMMVRRMTRFCVTVCGAEVVSRIRAACVDLGFLPVEKANKTLLITYRDMSFMVTIYEVPTKVLVDCRRSRGDGLEFKRAFLLLKASLSDIISKEGESWMESRGLTCSQNAEVASWTRRGVV
ncbi:hypothetical protein COOONC_24409 [Cooperia oncophora]